ncbi:alpha/beta hydrolase [Streptomyces sp. ACA25]|uniref:alpha/beta hydrolase n=1 Tax=Streptomyces sp. ACA25 TaxID=3022596 RepID=UPI00230729ED|nr:alpha/beta hydrolase [Streptomyces sp. ACA25]MDB1088550.1 alpha/beta hydrolase [Streptomyces sp. ACA25]
MADFLTLLRQPCTDLESAAAAWRALAGQCDSEQERHGSSITGALRAAEWQGRAADAGLAALDATEAQLGVIRSQATSIAAVVETLSTAMQQAGKLLRAVVREAESSGFTVHDSGRVTADYGPAAQHDPDYAVTIGAQRTGYQSRIDSAVAQAELASDTAARLLREFVPAQFDRRGAAADALADARAVLEARSVCTLLPDSMSPARAAKWWASLSEEDQALHLAAYPEEIGRADGLPVAARDHANRSVLDGRIAELARSGAAGTAEELADLTRLRDRMDRSHGSGEHLRPYLIGLDTEGDGKAIVSLGNPDTARNTAVFIPGTGARLGSVSGDIDRVENLVNAGALYAPAGETAGVMWLGYDAPDSVVPHATERSYANRGGPALASYVEGLRISHEAGDAHLTAVAHSYGSTVLGNAARTGTGIPVDDIIVAGSPGMQVNHASELNMAPDRVWAAQADGDHVPAAGQSFHAGSEYKGWGRWEVNHPAVEGFGANRITTETTGHSNYWEEDTVDLKNQAKIITGQHDMVRLQWKAAQ